MSKFDKELLNVGDDVVVHNDVGMFHGQVNHVDGRDILIVVDWDKTEVIPVVDGLSEVAGMQVGGDHYQTKIQPVEYIHANGLPFIEGNVVKYISRHKAKGGADDIEKAISYCKILLKLEYGYTDEQIGKLFEKKMETNNKQEKQGVKEVFDKVQKLLDSLQGKDATFLFHR